MNKTTLTLGVASCLVVGGIWLSSREDIGDSSQRDKINNPTSEQIQSGGIQKRTAADMWQVLNEATQEADATEVSIPTERDEILKFIEEHPTLKMRIQSMPWYQEFLFGRLTNKDMKEHIENAYRIEEYIEMNPILATKLQSSLTWQQYLRGEAPPHNIIYGEIPSLEKIEILSKDFPDVYQKGISSPMMRTESGELVGYMEQVNIFELLRVQSKYLADNPHVREKLTSYGITEDSIYRSDNRGEPFPVDGYFGYVDPIDALENRNSYTPEAWEIFDNSDIGRAYRDVRIHPRVALNYMNDIMLRLYP